MSKEEWSNQLSGDSRYLLSLLVVEVGGRGELEEAAVGLAAASDSAVTEVASSCRLMLKTSLPPGVAGVALALAVVVDPLSPTREELSASSLADPAYMSQVWSLICYTILVSTISLVYPNLVLRSLKLPVIPESEGRTRPLKKAFFCHFCEDSSREELNKSKN